MSLESDLESAQSASIRSDSSPERNSKHQPEPAKIKRFQIATSFPNYNSKHIDYVIIYKYDREDVDEKEIRKKNEIRKAFFKNLELEERIQVYYLRFNKDDEVHVYALLHAPMDRLLEEAEKVKLQMRLNNKFLHEDKEELETPSLEIFSNKLKKLGIKREIKKDPDGGVILSAEFEKSIKYLFDAFDEKNTREPFSNTIRSLLVDNILRNFSFKQIKDKYNSFRRSRDDGDAFSENFKKFRSSQTKKFAGLPFMLSEGYFDDALILHDRTHHFLTLGEMIQSVARDDMEHFETQMDFFNQISLENNHTKNGGKHPIDIRKELHLKWAKLSNFFRYQPINLIRDYFGESFSLYFAWIGHFIFCLIIPTIIGIIFFAIGLNRAINDRKIIANNGSISISYLEFTFAESFDNYLTPFFALLLCLWGALFTDTWIRENSRLAFEWDVLKYENEEPDLPEYTRRTKERKIELKEKSNYIKYIWSYEHHFKRACSFIVLIFMVFIVAMEVAAVILYRVYIKVKVFPRDETLQTFIGDVGSSIINSIFINIMNNIYDLIALKLTRWENYRTQTEFDDNLIFKLFAFQFVNSYASLFYIAFFRNIEYSNGIFNLGPEYLDKCDNDNCMALLSIQVFTVLLIKPFPSFFTSVIWPLVHLCIKRYKIRYQTKKINPVNDDRDRRNKNHIEMENDHVRTLKRNENAVSINIAIERNKSKSDKTIQCEYTEKVILYGYIILFACSFSLGPLIVLIILAFDLRVDGLRLLWLYRRPVGYKAQDIGAWFYILRFLNVIAIISNAFIIAFTSSLSRGFLQNKLENKLLFVVGFEHLVFFIWFLILMFLPDVPKNIQEKIRQEDRLVKSIFTEARSFNKKYEYRSRSAGVNGKPSTSRIKKIRELEGDEDQKKQIAIHNLKREMSILDSTEKKSAQRARENTVIMPILPISTSLTEIREMADSDNENKQGAIHDSKKKNSNHNSSRLPPLTKSDISNSKNERKKHLRVKEKILNSSSEP